MKLTIFITALFISCITTLHAQKTSLGVQFAPEYLLTSQGNDDWGYMAGIGIEHAPFERILFFEVNLQGVKKKYSVLSPDSILFFDANKVENNLFYMQLQTGLKMEINWDAENFLTYAEASFVFGYVVDNHAKYYLPLEAKEMKNNEIQKIVGAYQFGLGCAYDFGRVKLDTDLYVRYMPQIEKHSNQKFIAGGLGLSVFYVFY